VTGARLLWPALLLAAGALPGQARPAPDDHFASVQRTRYAALCRTRKDLDSCSDAVRWSPGDPALVATLADALMRAGRVPEALRDYHRAEALDPGLKGLEAKIKAAELRSSERHAAKKPPIDRVAAEQGTGRRYSNDDAEGQSH
jgi:predicted Zn-dependent protease